MKADVFMDGACFAIGVIVGTILGTICYVLIEHFLL